MTPRRRKNRRRRQRRYRLKRQLLGQLQSGLVEVAKLGGERARLVHPQYRNSIYPLI